MKRILIASLASLAVPLLAQADIASTESSSPSPWTVTDGAVIDFTVLRKGKPFGSHILTFDKESDGSFEVTTDVDLDVKFGPITAYKYRLDSVERWEGEKLVSINGKSNNNGRKGKVAAQAEGEQLQVDATKFEGQVPTSIIPSSHWNRKQMYQDRMISTETGELLDINVEKIGADTVLVGGSPVDATHYRLKSDIVVDLWYDDQSRWVKLAFEAQDQKIEYVLNQLY
jgi:hypothetical protein